MDSLFDLTFYTHSDEGVSDGFFIGLFATQEEAEIVAARYRNEVSGFKDYDCDAKIQEFLILGDADSIEKVYRFVGWNINEALDEVDILISNCFVSREQAEEVLGITKQELPREEWALNCHIIGECDWQAGFVR